MSPILLVIAAILIIGAVAVARRSTFMTGPFTYGPDWPPYQRGPTSGAMPTIELSPMIGCR